MTISSAKNDILTLGGGLGSMSLIIKMKRVGLKTDPCGTPFFWQYRVCTTNKGQSV